MSDLYMLTTRNDDGLYPYAGIPWYSTVFGRDGIITAMQMLWIDPAMAAGVLRHLARLQADKFDPKADAAPGKILHEMRGGEMASMEEVPFGQYYGSVDSTPLFVMLVGQYAERTGDMAFVRELWPAIEKALAWLDGPADVDGDGLIEYARGAADWPLQPRLEGLRTIPFSMRTAALPRVLSRYARCKATSTPRGSPHHSALKP